MNRDSIFFSITLFFAIAFISVVTLFSLIIQLEYQTFYSNTFKRYTIATKIISIGIRHKEPLHILTEQIRSVNLLIMDNLSNLSNVVEVEKHKTHLGSITVLTSEGRKFVKIHNMYASVIMEDLDPKIKLPIHLYISFFISMIILVIVYFFVINKLKPLSLLRAKIKKFGEGDLSVTTKASNNDEIAEVANEFDIAIKKIRGLDSSRKLFLRNIMHELKTPLTKGRLSTEMLEDSKNKARLIQVFSRIDVLIEQFAKIEQLTSGHLRINKSEFRFIDIFENVLDLLMIDKTCVSLTNADLKLNVDFDLFSVVVKNLIDNALKYSNDKKVSISIHDDKIFFTSIGDRLKENIEFYTKPFSKDNTDSKSGMGLGLYIVNEILAKHGFSLLYEHKNGFNSFIIPVSTYKE